MNHPATVNVRSGPVRSGSAAGRTPRLADEHEPDSPDRPPTNAIGGDAERIAHPGLFDWVPTAEPWSAAGGEYPIEGGVPHPHWVGEPAEHRIASGRIPIDEAAAVVRLLVALALAAFLLGMTVFYPVSPLGR